MSRYVADNRRMTMPAASGPRTQLRAETEPQPPFISTLHLEFAQPFTQNQSTSILPPDIISGFPVLPSQRSDQQFTNSVDSHLNELCNSNEDILFESGDPFELQTLTNWFPEAPYVDIADFTFPNVLSGQGFEDGSQIISPQGTASQAAEFYGDHFREGWGNNGNPDQLIHLGPRQDAFLSPFGRDTATLVQSTSPYDPTGVASVSSIPHALCNSCQQLQQAHNSTSSFNTAYDYNFLQAVPVFPHPFESGNVLNDQLASHDFISPSPAFDEFPVATPLFPSNLSSVLGSTPVSQRMVVDSFPTGSIEHVSTSSGSMPKRSANSKPGNNRVGRKGKPKCQSCRRKHGKCEYRNISEPCERCQKSKRPQDCIKLPGPKTQIRRAS